MRPRSSVAGQWIRYKDTCQRGGPCLLRHLDVGSLHEQTIVAGEATPVWSRRRNLRYTPLTTQRNDMRPALHTFDYKINGVKHWLPTTPDQSSPAF